MAGRDVGTDRQRAGPYDGHGRCHRLGSLPASVPNEARRDPSRSGGPLNPRPAGATGGSIIAKEHGRTPAGDAQEIRPSTGGGQDRDGPLGAEGKLLAGPMVSGLEWGRGRPANRSKASSDSAAD